MSHLFRPTSHLSSLSTISPRGPPSLHLHRCVSQPISMSSYLCLGPGHGELDKRPSGFIPRLCQHSSAYTCTYTHTTPSSQAHQRVRHGDSNRSSYFGCQAIPLRRPFILLTMISSLQVSCLHNVITCFAICLPQVAPINAVSVKAVWHDPRTP